MSQDKLEPHFRPIIDASAHGKIRLFTSSEVYDDVISALRSQKINLKTVLSFVIDMKTIPHQTLPVTPEIAAAALNLYMKHGGSRKLHYFDAFHAATSLMEKMTLVTSDRYMILHGREMEIETIDARTLRP